jgi:hypothetical protein
VIAGGTGVRAEPSSTFEITGSFVPAAEGVTVLVQIRSRAPVPVASVRIEGEWRGERARAFLAGPFSPGGFGEARLHFTRTPPPGMHALVLLLDFVRRDGDRAARGDEAAALLLAFDALPAPAVRLTAAPVALRESTEAAFSLESTDGEPHRIRLAVWLPRSLTCDPPAQAVDVPARGSVTARVRVFRSRAAPGRHELIAVAETDGAAPVRTSVATTAVDVTPETLWLRRARVPLAAAALLALLWALYRQYRNGA